MQDKIIVDTDPGIDDLLALIFSYRKKLPIAALTTVYGNSTIENVTRNAGYVIKSVGCDWDLFKGASSPLLDKATLAESHGQSGLGRLQPKDSEVKRPNETTVQDYLASLTTDENILLCLGPLTNIALAIQNKSDFLHNIRKLIVMGGAFSEKGNVTEYAEFNFYNDPEAAALVTETAYQHGIDMTIIPAEVCRKVLLTIADLQLLEDASSLPNLKEIVEPFIDYYMNDAVHGGYDGAVLYDVLVPLYYLFPELFTVTHARVTVETDNALHKGQTSLVENSKSTVKVCTDLNAHKAKQLVMDAMTSSSLLR